MQGPPEGCSYPGRPATVCRVRRIPPLPPARPSARLLLGAILIGTLAATGACGSPSKPPTPAPQPICVFHDRVQRAQARNVGVPSTAPMLTTGTVTMTAQTNLGAITVSVDRATAPCSALSFAYLAGRHYFDGGTCNRLTTAEIYTLTCGDPKGAILGTGPMYGFDEHTAGPPPTGGTTVTYPRGTVALVTTGSPYSGGGEFFVVYKDTTLPAGAYPVIGTVTAGMDIVDKIAKAGVNPPDSNSSPTDGPTKLTLTVTSLTVS